MARSPDDGGGEAPPDVKPADAAPAKVKDDRARPEDPPEPYRERWFFDNPSIGRAIRYTFGERRLARAVFINALLLVVALAGIQEAFGRGQLGLYSERIAYGRVAFLGLVAIEAIVLAILAPLGLVGLFEAERREECFDQVVASGVSPHRVIFGRFAACLAFLGVVLLSSLPFFCTTIVLDGATGGQVALAYVVLAGWAVCLCALATACAVALDDMTLPVVVGVLGAALALVLAAGRRVPPVFAAFSPVRHVVLDLADVAQDLRLGTFEGPSPFGVELPCAALTLAYYAVLSLIALAYAYVGPDLELTPGMDSFDSVSISPTAEATRARRGVARTLLRAVQLRFFYENVSPRAAAWSPAVRALATVGLFLGAHVIMLGALWPKAAPKSFADIDERLAFPFLGFAGGCMSLLALSGGGARSSLLARAPVARLGGLALGRFPALFLIMATALAIPGLLWWGATRFSGYSPDALLASQAVGLYALTVGYAAFVFSVALVLAMISTNPYTATGWALLVLFATNLTPAVWIPLFTGNLAGERSAFLLDLSPLVAGYSIARPGETFPFSTLDGDELVRYTHEPRWHAFAWFHAVVGLACLAGGVVLSRRELRAARAARAAPTPTKPPEAAPPTLTKPPEAVPGPAPAKPTEAAPGPPPDQAPTAEAP